MRTTLYSHTVNHIYEMCREVMDPDTLTKINTTLERYGYTHKYDGRGNWMQRWADAEHLKFAILVEMHNDICDILQAFEDERVRQEGDGLPALTNQ